MERPRLVDYLDYRRFLDDWFTWKKAVNARFSHRVFARLSGQSNPSLLLQVIQGKRNLTDVTTESYIAAMKLDEDEAEGFRMLVRLDQARTPAERTEVFERLSAMRTFRSARKLEGDSFRYLSRWYYVAVRELSLCPGFRFDASWVARTLRPAITEDEAKDALDLLVSLGMFVVGPDGEPRPAEVNLVTPHEVRGLAAYNYHRGMLALAAACLDGIPPSERHVGAVTIAIPESKIAQVKAELAALQERLLDLAAGAAAPDRIYQVTLQTFPLSFGVAQPGDFSPSLAGST